MSPFDSHPSTGLRRNVAALTLGTISLFAGAWIITRAPVTGLPPAGAMVAQDKTGSGASTYWRNDLGQSSQSGSLRVQGVLIYTGAVLTLPGTDARYLRKSGGTMTGALIVQSSISGSSLVVNGGTAVTRIISNTAVIDLGNLAAIGCEETTMSLTGAVLGDVVVPGIPAASMPTNGVFNMYVKAADQIAVKFCTVVSGDPASGTFRATVIRH